jgi:phosphoribosylformylglycinamidine synthase
MFTGHYQRGQVVRLPVAHHGGNYYVDDDGLKALEDNDQIAFRYTTPGGKVTAGANPNGSLDNIAGVFNAAGNVLGMMPHPERLADARLGGDDGKAMFASLVEALG